MGWQDDLAALLEETGGNIAGSAVGQAVGNVAGPVLGSGPVQLFGAAMDIPRQATFGAAGQLHAISEGRGPIDWSQAQAEEGARLAGIQQQDWGQFGILKTPVEVAANLALDPTTYAGFGAFGKAARGLEGASLLAREAGHPILSGGLRTGAAVSRGTQFLWNDAGQAVLEGGRIPAAITRGGADVFRFPAAMAGREVGIQPLFRAAKAPITRIRPNAFDLAPQFASRQEDDAIKHATSALESSGGISFPGQQPVASIFDTAAPPHVPYPHPPGSAPDLAYKAGIRGYLRLHDPKLGIIPSMQGQDLWVDPAKVTLTQAHLQDMADIGVAAMQRVTDEGGLFPSIIRATEGVRQMRQGIVDKFGRGIEPYIPQVEQTMRETMLRQKMNPDVMMPASRHFLPHGWSQGVMSNRRLLAVQDLMKKESLTREEALAEIARYPKKAQAVDAAAAHGAALLSLARQGPGEAYKEFLPKGLYFPQGLESARPNARVLIPEDFTTHLWTGEGPLNIDLSQAKEILGAHQPFGSNREAWNAYMKQQLPGIADDELATLAGMSQDMLYHAYVNAAHPISGGERGAERIFRATVDGTLEKKLMLSSGGKLANKNKKIAGLKGGPKGGLLPNLQELMGVYHEGISLPSGMGQARDYFPRAVNEIVSIVGHGNYDDAQILIHALALTSTATDVPHSADLALRVLAEWKFGSDETLRAQFGLSGVDFGGIMQKGLLRQDFDAQQQRSLATAFTRFADLNNPRVAITDSVHGGPKTHSYAGSFLAVLWRDGIEKALGKTGMGADVRRSLDEALSVFAWDRHHNRIDKGATGVNAIEAFLNRERGVLAAKAAGFSPEEAQSAGWLWVRSQQGLISPIKGDGDVAMALRTAIQKTWDHDAEAGQSWQEVVNKLQVEHGYSPEEAIDQAYDATRQVIFWRLLKKSLGEPKVQAALRQAGFAPDLTSLKDDMLGFMQRGAAGYAPPEWSNPLDGFHQPGGLADQILGSAPGQVMRFDGKAWTTAATGYGVPIATGKSVGVGQQQSLRKSLEGLLNRGVISDLFDAGSGVDNTSRVGLGLVQDGSQIRPAIFALTDNQASATAGAARSDLKRVHDLATGGGVSVPGGAPNRHLPGLLSDISGPGSPLTRPTLDAARTRGVSLMEMDTVNPWSIFQRKIVKPLMDAYARVSLKDGTKQLTGQDLGDIFHPSFPEKVVSATSPRSALLSDNDNAVLAQTLADGRSYRDVYQLEKMTATADMATLKAANIHWAANSKLEDRLALVKGNAALTKIIKDWHKKGIDILYAGDPSGAATASLIHLKNAEKGIDVAAPTNFALFRSAWGELAMFSPKNVLSNLLGAWTQNALDGTFDVGSWDNYVGAYKLARGGLEDTTKAEALASMKSAGTSQKWGIPQPPQMLRGGIRGITSSTTRITPSAVGELVGRVTRNEALGRKVGTPFIVRNDIAQAVDTVMRDAKWSAGIEDHMMEAMPAFESEVSRVAQGIPGFEFSIQQGVNVPPGGLSPDGLAQHFESLGIARGKAEHLGRTYANLQSRAGKLAREEMERVQFSYDYTNLDVAVSKIIPFHYWYSRALRYYGESAIRHPFLALNYMRAMDGIQDAQNDPGASARQKSFLRLMGTPIGFSLLMNPDALFGVVQVFNMDDSYEPDGQTTMGSTIQWMKDRGFGLYPWIDGALNLMGMYGNTFEPDLLGIRHKALVGSAINFVRAHTGFDPGTSPYADAMGQVRYSVSSFVDSFTPDWLAKTVPPRTGGSSQEASLDTMIESIVVDNNPGITNEQLLAIMTDPDSPQYTQAYQQVADAGLVQQLLNFTLPTSFRMRGNKKDVLASQIGTVYEAAQAAGVSPYDFAPTAGDLQFKARYKAMTGKDWQPGDYEDAKMTYDLIRAPAEAKPFILANAEYQHLGTPKQQKKFDTYWNLRNGNDPRTAGLPEESRKEIALEWADARHATDSINQMYELRDAFSSSHPEFQEFKDWQSRVGNLAGLYGGNLAEYRRRASQQNPNAARYFADSLEFVQRTFPQDQWTVQLDKATTSAAAFNAITGKGTNRQNAGPIPGVPRADVTLPTMEPPAPPQYASTTPDWVKVLGSIQGVSPRF